MTFASWKFQSTFLCFFDPLAWATGWSLGFLWMAEAGGLQP